MSRLLSARKIALVWTSLVDLGVENRPGALTAGGHEPQAGLGNEVAHLGERVVAVGLAVRAPLPDVVGEPLEDLDTPRPALPARRSWPGARARPRAGRRRR